VNELQLPALARASLAETTAELLRERILTGTFPPGFRLVEADIARQLQTSRGPVREALAMLRAEGLVDEDPGRGAFVAVLDAREIEEIYEVRAALESAAARLVIARGDPADRRALEAALDEMRRAAAAGDRVALIDADLALHGTLCRVSGNQRLYRIWETQVGLLRALIRLETTRLVPAFEPLVDEHAHLVAEIGSGDPGRAEAACWALFDRTSRLLIEAREHVELADTASLGAEREPSLAREWTRSTD
jgi:DNA-binding GntR family transcriptional regulator